MCLGLKPDEVPHFVALACFADWRQATRTWLLSRGLDMIEFPWFEDQQSIIDQLALTAHDVPVMLSGWAERGDLHSVVVYRGRVYDPHPSDAGLCGPHPIENGKQDVQYWVRIIAPRLVPAHTITS